MTETKPANDPAVRALARALLHSEMTLDGKDVAKEDLRQAWSERNKDLMRKARRLQLLLRRQGCAVTETVVPGED